MYVYRGIHIPMMVTKIDFLDRGGAGPWGAGLAELLASLQALGARFVVALPALRAVARLPTRARPQSNACKNA